MSRLPSRDLAVARESAAKAQANETVAAAIRAGKFDDWPNVQGALIAIDAFRNSFQAKALSGTNSNTEDA